MTSKVPNIELYRKNHSKLHSDYWFMASVKLRLMKNNELYLLINHYHSGFGGISNKVDYAVFLGKAKQENFPKMQKIIKKNLRGKLRKLRFRIADVNEQNKNDNHYHIHATCVGSDERFGDNLLYHHTKKYTDINEVLKDKKHYEDIGYDFFYRKKYIA